MPSEAVIITKIPNSILPYYSIIFFIRYISNSAQQAYICLTQVHAKAVKIFKLLFILRRFQIKRSIRNYKTLKSILEIPSSGFFYMSVRLYLQPMIKAANFNLWTLGKSELVGCVKRLYSLYSIVYDLQITTVMLRTWLSHNSQENICNLYNSHHFPATAIVGITKAPFTNHVMLRVKRQRIFANILHQSSYCKSRQNWTFDLSIWILASLHLGKWVTIE